MQCANYTQNMQSHMLACCCCCRFEFNKAPNPSYKPGKFQLAIEGGISAYKAPRPALVAVSSAGVIRHWSFSQPS
jgi:hypothetical protein